MTKTKTEQINIFQPKKYLYAQKIKLSLEPMAKEPFVFYNERITCSKDIFNLSGTIYKAFDAHPELYEEFFVLYLKRNLRINAMHHVSSGGLYGTVVDTKKIMAAALNINCSGMILIHNHPSGNLKPSQADIVLTKKIMNAANLFDISVYDHVIVTTNNYLSFSDERLLSK